MRCISLALMSMLMLSTAAFASNFTVSPTEANLSSSKASALIALKNVGKTAMRFEITAFVWSESELGEMTLTPTSDLTFFPKLVELGPGRSRNIRIGFGGKSIGNIEQSFRLFVEELPDESNTKPSSIAIRTKIGLPVFIRPAKPARSGAIESVTIENGKAIAKVRNTGNLHLTVENVTLRGLSASGTQTFSVRADGWYVLPGATRIFQVPLSAASCTGTATLTAEVSGHGKTVKGNGAVSAGSCAGR